MLIICELENTGKRIVLISRGPGNTGTPRPIEVRDINSDDVHSFSIKLDMETGAI